MSCVLVGKRAFPSLSFSLAPTCGVRLKAGGEGLRNVTDNVVLCLIGGQWRVRDEVRDEFTRIWYYGSSSTGKSDRDDNGQGLQSDFQVSNSRYL